MTYGYAILFFAGGYIAGLWTMAWAQRERIRHERETERETEYLAKQFEKMTEPGK